MNRIRVTLVGEKEVSWAIKTDLLLAKESLSDVVVFVQAGKTDFLHCVWPNEYYKDYMQLSPKERFVAVFQGNPIRLFENSLSFFWFCQDTHCVAQTQEAYKILKNSLLSNIHYIPYIADERNFFYIADKKSLRNKYGIPQDRFIICNFFRDSLGSDLDKFKPEKGGDIFCSLLYEVERVLGKGKIHVLLTGVRRHAIMKQLDCYGIEYTYIGKKVMEDDSDINLQNAETINELYNASDLLLVTSRSEGAPRAILEAAAAKLPILSTPVGVANDLLDYDAIIENFTDGIDKLVRQITTRYLNSNIDNIYKKLIDNHSVKSVGKRWENVYTLLYQNLGFSQNIVASENVFCNFHRKLNRKYRSITERYKRSKCKSLCVWYNPNMDAVEIIKKFETLFRKKNIRVYKNNYKFSGIHIILTTNIDDTLKTDIEKIKHSKIVLFLFFNSFAKNVFFDNLMTIGENIADKIIWQSYLSWNQYRYFSNCDLFFLPLFSLEFNKLRKEEYDEKQEIQKLNLKMKRYKNLLVIFSEDLPQKYESILCYDGEWNDEDSLDKIKKQMIYIVHKDADKDPYLSAIMNMEIPIVFLESDFNNLFFGVLRLKYSNEDEFSQCIREACRIYEKYKEITQFPSFSDVGDLFIKTLFI